MDFNLDYLIERISNLWRLTLQRGMNLQADKRNAGC